jgi:hypothetical protein
VYLVRAWGEFPWTTYVIIAGPAFLVAAVFLVSWLIRPRTRVNSTSSVETRS